MKLVNVIKWITSLAAGALLGGGTGIGIAIGLGLYSQWRHPEDASAGSVGIVVIGTFPLGVLLGMVAGKFVAERWIKRGPGNRVGFDVVPKTKR